MTFDSKMTIEGHLRSVARAASQTLDILRKSWRVFHARLLFGDASGIMSYYFWSTVLQFGARFVGCTSDTYEPSRCRTSQYSRTFVLISISVKRSCDPVFDGVGLECFKNRANIFDWPTLLVPLLSSIAFPFLFLHSVGWNCGAGVL